MWVNNTFIYYHNGYYGLICNFICNPEFLILKTKHLKDLYSLIKAQTYFELYFL